jgi:valyl-tRNA synthetase
MKPLPKQYDQQAREKFWQQHWANSDVHHFRDDLPREQTFVIDTPPPTVSGVLHMGHIFSYTQADFVARYQRMSGKDVFYPMGFDDNGLPTERLVEKIKGVRGSTMPRAEFVALCREVVKEAEDEFRTLFKSTALSVDWRKEYQTISDDVRKLSQASFVDLLQKGEAYRDFRPTYWDWVDQTAIAQAEIENKEMPGVMNEIEFTLEGGTPLVIMTTRPELLGACVAVMYHPEDPNAAKYKDKHAITPLFGIKVPMIADELVEREKGTGLVMCCTFGDDTDKEWWYTYKDKYNLPLIKGITPEGRVTTAGIIPSVQAEPNRTIEEIIESDPKYCFFAAPPKIKQANTKIIELLKAQGKLLNQTPMVHTVKCAERSGTPIEIIATYQWFIRITDKKEALLAKGAECNWYPEYMRIRLNQWIEGLKEDWCISRQRFFGVPFPVWYKYKLEGGFLDFIIPTLEELPLDPVVTPPKDYEYIETSGVTPVAGQMGKFYKARHKTTGEICKISPCYDVMDTWATSSISPQINARSLTPNKLFPADVRPQAHEIIRTWAFYTIVKAHLHGDCIPWKNVMISGWCLAADKTKMSKSKGNVVTPVALIEEKGTDAVRYWASTSRLGTDTAFSEDLLKIGRKLVNKLWNASQFAAINLDKLQNAPVTAIEDTRMGYITEALDLWILSRLNQCIKKATQQFEQFEYCDARVAIEDFFWNDFCDNYLELVKARSYGESQGSQQSALHTIYHCLDGLLKLFAPFVPHICEEIYSNLFDDSYAKTGSIHARGSWPKAEHYPYDAEAEKSGMAAVDVLNVIRKAKSEAGVSIKHPVDTVSVVSKSESPAPTWKHIEAVLADLKAAANAHLIIESSNAEPSVLTDKGWFAIKVVLAKMEDHKRNPDQGEHEKLEGTALHGPGKPDLSKHVVKLQVNSLPENLQRQK